MEWFAIISLIVIGLFLVIVELLFIPGTTFFGIGGALFMLSGVAYSYYEFGTATGNWIFFLSFLSSVLTIVLSLRSKTWDKYSLKTVLEGRSFEDVGAVLQIGERGTTLSTLRPVGKAEFPQGVFEVSSSGPMIEPGTKVQIERITGNKIIVQPI